jgi:hypothetical protein
MICKDDIMAEQEALAAWWLVAGVRQLRARGGLGHRATTRTANRIRDGQEGSRLPYAVCNNQGQLEGKVDRRAVYLVPSLTRSFKSRPC